MKFMKYFTLLSLLATAGANAVTNGDFEDWQDGKPIGWNFNEGIYEPDSLMKVSGRYSLRMKTSTEQKALWQNNTISQHVKLEPNTEYILELNAAKEDTGTLRFNLFPVVNGKNQKSIAEFSRWVWGFPFTAFKREFKTGNTTDYQLIINHYGSAETFCYLDKISIVKKTVQAPILSTGFYNLSSMYHFNGDIPTAASVLKELDFVSCRNETESTLVLWKPETSQQNVTLKVKSVQGIPVDAFTIRDLIDSVLPLSKPRNIAKGETGAWQVFLKITSTISPGEYRAELELSADGKTVKIIPANINIVDITLPAPNITFLVYHAENYTPERFLTPELREMYYRDMGEHGMNSFTLYNNPQNAKEADFRYNYSHDIKLIPEKFRERNDKIDPNRNYDQVQWRKIFNFGLDAQMALAAKYGLVNKANPILWLPTKLNNYGFGGMPVEALKKALIKWRDNPEWPEPLLYVMDEPYDIPERIAGALSIFRNLKKNNIAVRTVTAHPHPDILGEYYDVWILSTSQVNVENMKKAIEMKREVWSYNCAIQNTNAAFFRAMYGFWAHLNQLKGVATWAYYDARERFVEKEDGTIKDTSSRLSRVGLSPSGPIPTVAWEATREGTEDYRLAQHYYELMGKLVKQRQYYLDEAGKVLQFADQQAIRNRERAKYLKADPQKTPPTWEADTKERADAEKLFLKHLELDRIYRCCKQSLVLLETVGSLAQSGRSVDEEIRKTWYPNLGENNTPDDAEVKRKILLPYVLMLQNVMSREISQSK